MNSDIIISVNWNFNPFQEYNDVVAEFPRESVEIIHLSVNMRLNLEYFNLTLKYWHQIDRQSCLFSILVATFIMVWWSLVIFANSTAKRIH